MKAILASNQAPSKKGGWKGLHAHASKFPENLGIWILFVNLLGPYIKKCLVDKKYNGSFKSTIVLRFSTYALEKLSLGKYPIILRMREQSVQAQANARGLYSRCDLHLK